MGFNPGRIIGHIANIPGYSEACILITYHHYKIYSIVFSLTLPALNAVSLTISGFKSNISIIIVLVSLFSIQSFSQQINWGDSLSPYIASKVNLKPGLHYSIGSTSLVVPHLGSVTGFTFSPFLTIPLSPRWSVEGGIIAGRYYS